MITDLHRQLPNFFNENLLAEVGMKLPSSEMIRRTAFFPGGTGLFNKVEVTTIPQKDILIVGSDFGTYGSFCKALKNGSEWKQSATWKNLQRIFNENTMELADCFFTNFFMGFRDETRGGNYARETGKIQAWRNLNFIKKCIEFFHIQVKSIQPKLIISLGREAFNRISEVGNMPHEYDTFREIYTNLKQEKKFVLDFTFNGRSEIHIYPMIHPSFYYSNVKKLFNNRIPTLKDYIGWNSRTLRSLIY